jgi:predicted nucleic acid-binding Zn ribbon protein
MTQAEMRDCPVCGSRYYMFPDEVCSSKCEIRRMEADDPA